MRRWNWRRTTHIYCCVWRVCTTRQGSPERRRKWRSSWNGEGGGCLINQGQHILDIWQWLFGMPGSLTAQIAFGKYNDFKVDDEAVLLPPPPLPTETCRRPEGCGRSFCGTRNGTGITLTVPITFTAIWPSNARRRRPRSWPCWKTTSNSPFPTSA